MGVCRNMVFLRWWKSWLGTAGMPTHINFISIETFSAHIITDHAMILLVLIYAHRFPGKPFAPWLFGSDQCEHFFSEMRSFSINQPNWTIQDLLPLVQRFVHQYEELSKADVHLPHVVSARGYARSNYTPSSEQNDNAYVPAEQLRSKDVEQEYSLAVEELRPVFNALGCAEDLRDAGNWHWPLLEGWPAVEKASAAEEKNF